MEYVIALRAPAEGEEDIGEVKMIRLIHGFNIAD